MREDLRNLPFGPLTLEAHDRLSNTHLDASQVDLQRIAVERGVEFGDAARRKFAEAIEERKRIRDIGKAATSDLEEL